MDILEMLQAKIGFSNTEIKIAEYILEHCHQVGGMSVNALAKETFSSNASVLRMCRKMGLSGYREFQIALLARLSMQQNKGERISPHDASNAIMELVSNAIAGAAGNCLSYISQESLILASAWMSQSNQVYLYSAAYFNALALYHTLSVLGIAVSVPDLFHEAHRERENLEGNVALFITYSDGAVHETQKKMASLRKRGCRVIAISPESACPNADIFIRLPRGETNCPYAQEAYLQAALLYTITCLRYMIDAAKDVASTE